MSAFLAYTYDNTLEGLLSAIFAAYENREDPTDIIPPENLQLRLEQTVKHIPTNMEHAIRVQQGICKKCGVQVFETIRNASLACKPETGTVIYRFVRFAMRYPYRVLNQLTNPAVEPVLKLEKFVNNERHYMLQFIRFEELEGGVWFARCNPKANVVPLIMDWFSARFNTQAFIIFDETHNLAGVFEGKDWYLVKSDVVTLPPKTQNEKLVQLVWRRFYETLSVEARYNPELRRSFMPKRFWSNITEMKEENDTQALGHCPTTQNRGGC